MFSIIQITIMPGGKNKILTSYINLKSIQGFN